MNVTGKYGLSIFFSYTSPKNQAISGRIVPPGLEIVELLVDGEVLFEHNGKMERFGRGWIFWQQAGDYTIHISVPGKTYTCLAFQMIARQERIVPRVSRWNDLATLDDFIHRAVLLRQDPHCDLEVLEQLFRAELMKHAYLWRSICQKSNYPKGLVKAMHVMTEKISEPVSIEDVASICGVSVSCLFQLFRTYLQTSPHQWLREQRLQKAELLLCVGHDSIKEIAAACGFESMEGFYGAFRAKHHIPPGEFRRTRTVNSFY